MTYFEKVLQRYLQPGEVTLNDVFRRTAHFLKPDDNSVHEETIFELLSKSVFLPNSPTLANVGSTRGGCSACYVLPLEDSVGGIYQTALEQARVHAAFGGTGFDLSTIRPKGSLISSSGGDSCGPCAVLEFLNQSAHLIRQGGKREGANMGVLYDDHPDLDEFISYKDSRPYLKHFNISVGVHEDGVSKSDRNDLLMRIAEHSHATGDPGILYVDRLNTSNLYLEELGGIRTTNPCITGRHIVATGDGLKRMSDIQIGERIWVANGSFETVVKVFDVGVRDVYRVTTERGYTLDGTTDHQICTPNGLFKIEYLKVGDIIECQDHGFLPPGGDYDEGYLAGVIFGDGWISCNRVGISGSVDDKDDLENLLSYINTKFDCNLSIRSYLQRSGNEVLRIMSGKKAFYEFGKNAKDLDWCIGHPKEWLRGFISGWLFADGHIESGTSNAIALSNANRDNLDVFSSIILQFGILTSNIYEVKRTGHISDDFYGFNGSKDVTEDTYSYRLQITGEHKHLLVEEFPMTGSIKRNMDFKNKSSSHKGTTLQKIVSIEYLGQDNVYDFTTDGTKIFYANGIRNLDCGEQPLRPYECCTLGSINLSTQVVDGEFDYNGFKDIVAIGVRLLDRVIDINHYPLDKIAYTTIRSRKIGLGIMGWADALIKMGISYQSTEAKDLIHKIGPAMQRTAVEVSRELGDLYGNHEFGVRRNENLLTIAPTGTLSYFAGCSGGIEPNFGWDIIRETEAGETTIKHPLYEKYIRGTELEKDTAHSISAYWQIIHQAAWQVYVDNAVSKTINLPNTATIDDFYAAYQQSFEQNCKGITIYRDGSKNIQTLRHSDSPVNYRERPATIYERKSGCGTIYVIPSVLPGNMAPWDTFAVTSGGCAANSEAIGRLISGWLQDGGTPVGISKILHNVDCPKCSRRDGCDGLSCADIIGNVLVEHYLKEEVDSRPQCPNCGFHLNFGSGCGQGECPKCGWSGCN